MRAWQPRLLAVCHWSYPRGALVTCAHAFSNSAQDTKTEKPPISQKVKFIDQRRIVARGGRGGGGSNALFGRTGHHPRAAGGNGAPGGSVILRATCQLTGLGNIPLHAEAERGGHGDKQWMHGKRGADKVVHVPLGTIVWQLVQLRDTAGKRPRSISPHHQAAAATQHISPHPETYYMQHLQQVMLSADEMAQPVASTSSRPSSTLTRRRLFDDSSRPSSDAASVALDEDHHNDGRQGSCDTTVSSSIHTKLSSQDSGTSAAFSASCASTQSASHTSGILEETASDNIGSLFKNLVQRRQLLTNKEKLHLLHYGSLLETEDVPACLDEERGQVTDSQDEDMADNSGTATGHDLPYLDDSSWNDEGDVDRCFTKPQVWSILSAQAELLGILEHEGQEVLVAQGGQGGRGNAAAPSTPQRPASRIRTDGLPGEEVMLLLQMRLMADVALVGLPNVGKSSLIAALTGARAQVGSYAFTTLRPQLGAMLPSMPDTGSPTSSHDSDLTMDALGHNRDSITSAAPANEEHSAVLAAAAAQAADTTGTLTGHQLVIADLPGLVSGAHMGKGRGVDFLKHVQKARCIAIVVDLSGTSPGTSMTEGSQQSCQSAVSDASQQQTASDHKAFKVPYSPTQQLEVLMDELQSFDAATLSLPMLVIANKVDAMSAKAAAAALEQLKAATHLPIVPVSARARLGLHRLKHCLQLLLHGSEKL